MRLYVIPTLIAAMISMAAGTAFSQSSAPETAEEATKKYEAKAQDSDGGDTASPLSPVEVTAFGRANRGSCSVGQAVEYTLTITSKALRGKGVVLHNYELPLAQGLDIVHQTQKTKKLVQGNTEITTVIRYIEYNCVSEGNYELGPVTIPFEMAGGDQVESTAVASAVMITVKPGLTDRMRSSKSGKWIAFITGLAAFVVAAFLFKRRLRRSRSFDEAVARAQEAVETDEDPWDGLAEESAGQIDGNFYARLEELFWAEAFFPEEVTEGAAATRISMLAQRGVPLELLNEVRKAVNACQVGRYTGSASRGDAMSALTQAKEIVKKLSAYRPEKIEEDDNGTA